MAAESKRRHTFLANAIKLQTAFTEAGLDLELRSGSRGTYVLSVTDSQILTRAQLENSNPHGFPLSGRATRKTTALTRQRIPSHILQSLEPEITSVEQLSALLSLGHVFRTHVRMGRVLTAPEKGASEHDRQTLTIDPDKQILRIGRFSLCGEKVQGLEFYPEPQKLSL